MSNNKQTFQGFSEKTFDFLLELSVNNNRAWLESQRHIYKKEVQEPMIALEDELSKKILSIDPSVRTGRFAVSRINRDTRFSKDKSPYRDHAWIVYRNPNYRLSEYFTIYFEISPVNYGYGMGLYGAHPKFMEFFRKKAAANPAALVNILERSGLYEDYTLMGSDYVRPKISGLHDKLMPLVNKRGFSFVHKDAELPKTYSHDLVDELYAAFDQMTEFYQFVQGYQNA